MSNGWGHNGYKYRIFVEVGRIELPSEQTVQTASTCVDYYLYLT